MNIKEKIRKQSSKHRPQRRRVEFVRKPKLVSFTIPILSPSALHSAMFDYAEVFQVAPLSRKLCRPNIDSVGATRGGERPRSATGGFQPRE
jgi:hypothetical protein